MSSDYELRTTNDMPGKPSGLLLVDKPKGWTSFDVVAKVRGVFLADLRKKYPGQKIKLKVGHSGTLDPLATGLLVLAVGKTTKQIPTLIKKDKVYIVDAILGQTSTTGDAEGELLRTKHYELPTKAAVKAALSLFKGEIEQIPPAYSAIKVDGQRAYKLARAGKEVKLDPRKVTIHSISDVSYEWPKLRFTAHVSSGTYIRSLVEDIGNALETGAYMSDLRRTEVGAFSIEDAVLVSKETKKESIDTALMLAEQGKDQ